MNNAKIIASETFYNGAKGEYRLDVLATRFGGYEFFVIVGKNVIRQSSDIVKATSGLDYFGIGAAVEKALVAVATHMDTTSTNCPACSQLDANIEDCPFCHGTGTQDDESAAMFWLDHSWTQDQMRYICSMCGKTWGGVPCGPPSHGLCSDECMETMLSGCGS